MPRMGRWVVVLVWMGGCANDPVSLDDSKSKEGASEFEPYELAPEAPVNGVQVHLEPFWLEPFEEVERCWFIQADLNMPANVTSMRVVGRPGLHHSIILKTDSVFDEHIEDCFGIPLSLIYNPTGLPEPMLITSTQVWDETLAFPPGVGMPIRGGQQLVVNFHYLNSTDEPAPAELWLNLEFAETGEVNEFAYGFIYGNIGGIDIPPQSRQSLTTTCNMPKANLFSLTPHLHQKGSKFEAWLDRPDGMQPLVSDEGWFDPDTVSYSPSVAMESSDDLRFTCTWDNDTDESVDFGETSKDEMCFVFGHYYPAYAPAFGFEGIGCDELENTVEPL